MNDIDNSDEYKDFTAIHNFQPVDPPRLRVHGFILTPTPGWTLTLTKAEPQGINPEALLLHLERKAPTGIVAQHTVFSEVAYSEETSNNYTEVFIEPDGISINVEVVDYTVIGCGGPLDPSLCCAATCCAAFSREEPRGISQRKL